ncbi:hypothetical protein L3X38_005283 [Prunus dulcis]|uniref:Uncharacterized protein n=1 Tax=Prunus dulcis TaxID=3755 RepID=A0AAD4ZQN6_PRUDU|nr:hypothetical protein L3X38_005283 [Prunus dulcis]
MKEEGASCQTGAWVFERAFFFWDEDEDEDDEEAEAGGWSWRPQVNGASEGEEAANVDSRRERVEGRPAFSSNRRLYTSVEVAS